jgi:hypothetical protein
MMPTGASTWSAVAFNYNSSAGVTLGALACGPTTSASVTSVTTTSDAFDNKWLRMCVRVPLTYTAPAGGRWLLRYTVGSGATVSPMKEDTLTMRASVAGNPVHLILP